STTICQVVEKLRKLGINVHTTKEPTTGPLGLVVRSSEETLNGNAFACLIAADRYHHLKQEIEPALCEGKVVICDRYVESSLVLQVLDGLEIDFVWALNQMVRRPDLSIILIASPEVLASRLSQRSILSRFERTKERSDEVTLYLEAATYLNLRGYHTIVFNNDPSNYENTVLEITRLILSILGEA
ncbi:MAG: dTMP kinase, partial [Chthonomonadales bacterium]